QHSIPIGAIGLAEQGTHQQAKETAHGQGVHVKDLEAHKVDHAEHQEDKHGDYRQSLPAAELNRISLSLFHNSGNPLLLAKLDEGGLDPLQSGHHLGILTEGAKDDAQVPFALRAVGSAGIHHHVGFFDDVGVDLISSAQPGNIDPAEEGALRHGHGYAGNGVEDVIDYLPAAVKDPVVLLQEGGIFQSRDS